MNAYCDVLYVLVLVIIFIMAGIALRWIKTADLLRSLCVKYLSQIWWQRGKVPATDELEAEIDKDLKTLEEGK